MRPEFDLPLLLKNFTQLLQSPFFNKEVSNHIDPFIKYLEWLIAESGNFRKDQIEGVVNEIWREYYHFNGSTTRDIPYEIMHCIELALKPWNDGTPTAIAPALRDGKDYYFIPIVNVSQLIERYTQPCPLILSPMQTIFIALPRIYKNFPLFCLPLYHELGHFIEQKYNIAVIVTNYSKISVFGEFSDIEFYITELANEPRKQNLIKIQYLKEIFADVFAACYLGDVMINVLQSLAETHPFSETHPSTQARVQVIQSFLSGKDLEIFKMFNEILAIFQKPQLRSFLKEPSVDAHFDDYLPIPLSNDSEVHGLMACAWKYLEKKGSTADDVIRINDLVEKSVRSYAIQDKWK